MTRSAHPTRQHLIDTAKDLFVRQGITQTTTRQIADTAGVNEVTLFRHFGTKQGLLLAVFADLGVFDGVGDLPLQVRPDLDLYEGLLIYVTQCFKALANNPELVRSVVGEAGQFSALHKEALQQGFRQAQEQFAQYLNQAYTFNQSIASDQRIDLLKASAMLHVLILGVALLEITAGLPALSDLSVSSDLAAPSQYSDSLESRVEPSNSEEIWLNGCLQFWLSSMNLKL